MSEGVPAFEFHLKGVPSPASRTRTPKGRARPSPGASPRVSDDDDDEPGGGARGLEIETLRAMCSQPTSAMTSPAPHRSGGGGFRGSQLSSPLAGSRSVPQLRAAEEELRHL